MALKNPSIRKTVHTVGVVGVRDHRGALYSNKSYIIRTFEKHLTQQGQHQIAVVTGGGKGVESIIVEWCENNGVDCLKIPPNIADHGNKKAFIVRNNNIVAQCNELVLFWDGSLSLLGESIPTAMHLSIQATVYPVI